MLKVKLKGKTFLIKKIREAREQCEEEKERGGGSLRICLTLINKRKKGWGYFKDLSDTDKEKKEREWWHFEELFDRKGL
jgi:hypothetical protein